MEHGHAANPGPQATRIGGKTIHRLRRRPEQDRIDGGLVLERHRGNGGWHCKDDVKVGNRQQFGLARRQPGLPCRALALFTAKVGTMAVAAGVVGDARRAAIIAGLDMAAERLRPAGNDGAHHPFLDTAKVSGMGKAPGLAMAAQNIGHLDAGAISRGCGGNGGIGHGPLPGTLLSRRHHLQRQAVKRALRCPYRMGRHLRVEGRCGEIAMACAALAVAKKNLNDPDVGSVFQKMGGKAVAQRVQRHPLGKASGFDRRAAGGVQHGGVNRHSVQLPGGLGQASGGQREFVPVLARAGSAWSSR